MFAVLIALGLDDPAGGAVVFHQDQVPEHAELAWYLNTVTPVNRLMRMTTWKVNVARARFTGIDLTDSPHSTQSKLATLRNANSEDEVDESMLMLGLMAYPVLQAADILLYK